MSGFYGPIDYGSPVQGLSSLSATAVTLATAPTLTTKVSIFTTVSAGAIVLLPFVTNVQLIVMNRGANALTIATLNDQIETYGTSVQIAPGGDSSFWMFDPPMKVPPRTWWLS